MRKFQRVEGPVLQDNLEKENPTEEIEEEKLDVNCLDVVLERVAAGLIGTLRIEDDMNKPLLRKDDFAHIRTPQRLEKKDMVLYKSHDEYFIRRIIKFKEFSIYVAGDHEKEYHVIHKEDIIGKVIGRQRGRRFLTFVLKPTKTIYKFRKVNLAYFRLKDRVLDYEDDVNNQALENAMQNLEQTQQDTQQQYKYDFDLDSELSSFLDPDELVRQLETAEAQPVEEEIQYVDEDGNPIDPNEIQEGDEVVDYVEVEEAPEEEETLLDDDASIEQFDDEAIKAKKAIEASYEEASSDEPILSNAAYEAEDDTHADTATSTDNEENKQE